jgi:hypothetical protein
MGEVWMGGGRAGEPPIAATARAAERRGRALETEFAALLTRIAEVGGPLDQIGDWFDRHEDHLLGGGGADARLRSVVQEALAVCWSVRCRRLTEEFARAQLRRLACVLSRREPPAVETKL